MAIDILSYNAINCRTQQNAAIINNLNVSKSFYNPADVTLWNDVLPMCITSGGTVLNVCDPNGTYRCGVCCLWTVPSGVTRAQFQLWGAGAGSGAGQCCGGSLPGATGAYAIVTIPVTAGCQYTICSGCAYCCFAAYTGIPADGCASFVTGYGLTNFCAEGGRATLCSIPCLYGTSKYQLTNMSNMSNPVQSFTGCMACMCFCCFGGSFCTGSSVPISLPVLKSDRTFYGNTSTAGVNVCGLSSVITSGVYFDSNLYGYHLIPPVPTPCCATSHVPDTTFCGSCWHCQTFTSGTCGGACCSTIQATYTKYFTWPGQGGVGQHIMGGQTTWCGDAGRMGMVKVTYC